MQKFRDTEDAALTAAKKKLCELLEPLAEEERKALLRLLLEVTE